MQDTGTSSLTAPVVSAPPIRRGAVVLCEIAAVAVLYYLAGRLGYLLAIPPGYATPLWPPAGIALAAVLLRGPRVLPGVFIGSLGINLPMLLPAAESALLAAGSGQLVIGIGAALQALLGAELVRRIVGFPSALGPFRDNLFFLLLGGPIACVLNASVGTSVLIMTGAVPAESLVYNWITWWVGDTLGVLLLTPIILAFLATPESAWRPRRISVVLPLLLAFALIIAGFHHLSRVESLRAELGLVRQGTVLAHVLESTMERHVEVVWSIESFFNSSDRVTRENFRDFVNRSLLRHPGIHALSWNPVVSRRQRAAFERSSGDGTRPIRITERNADGALVPAGERPYYVTVQYIEPMEGNQAALGFDVNSNPLRRTALDKARVTGRATGTRPITLVQEQSTQAGMLVFVPVYGEGFNEPGVSRSLRGYGVGVFRLGDLIATAFESSAASDVIARVRGAGGEPLGSYEVVSGRVSLIENDTGNAESNAWLTWTAPIRIADQRLELEVTRTPKYLAGYRLRESLILLAMLALCLMATGIVFLLAGIPMKLQAEVDRAVAENHRNEEQLRLRELELAGARKMEALGQLTGGIAHDFNNLLTVVLGNLQLAQRSTDITPRVKSKLETAMKAAMRGATLVQRLLAFGRKQHLAPTVLDVNELARNLEALLGTTLGEQIEFRLTLADDACRTHVDASQLENALVNLAVNARDAMPEGGTLELITENVEEDGSNSQLPAGRYLRLSVRDTGSGMAREVAERAFEPFFTTKEVGRGTGLGLSMVHGFVHQSGGHAEIHSAPNEGTRVSLYLPVVDEDAAGAWKELRSA